jgi:hypothetical protein
MSAISPRAITDAAEVRRRDLPVSIALLLFVGGIGAAVLETSLAVAWAGALACLLIADLQLHRRMEARGSALSSWLLPAWHAAMASVFAALPLALWIDGAPAAMAAAFALWLVGILRPFVSGYSLSPVLALASAAPSAIGLLIAPTAVALASGRPDWDAAVIASIAGAGLIAFVVREGLAGLAARARAGEIDRAVSAMVTQLESALGAQRVQFVDVAGRVWAGRVREIAGELANAWSDVIAGLGEGQHYYRDAWEVRPWRSPEGDLVGAIVIERGASTVAFATREASTETQIAKRA